MSDSELLMMNEAAEAGEEAFSRHQWRAAEELRQVTYLHNTSILDIRSRQIFQ